MFGRTNDIPPYLSPVDALIQWLVDEPDHDYVIAADDVQAQGDLLAGLVVFCGAYHPLDGALEDLWGC